MVRHIEIGKPYVKRSSISGKARRVIPIENKGEKIVVICDDNGKKLIVSRWRLHNDSIVSTDSPTFAPSDDLAEQLDKLLKD